MKDQFAPYEIANKLKELGFDEECYGYYTTNGLRYEFQYYDFGRTNSTLDDLYKVSKPDCTAPLWQQATQFLREKYGIHIGIAYKEDHYFGNIYDADNLIITSRVKEYNEALHHSILEAINLIATKSRRMPIYTGRSADDSYIWKKCRYIHSQ